MYVLKRDGRREEVHFDKITARIRKLCDGLDTRYVDPVRRAETEEGWDPKLNRRRNDALASARVGRERVAVRLVGLR